MDRWSRRSLLALLLVVGITVATPLVLTRRVNARAAAAQHRASEEQQRLLAEEYVRPAATSPSTTCDTGRELRAKLSELDHADFRPYADADDYDELIDALAPCDRSSGAMRRPDGSSLVAPLVRYLTWLEPERCGEIAPVILRVALDEPVPRTFAGDVLAATRRCVERGLNPKGLADQLAEITTHRRPFATTAKLAVLEGALEQAERIRAAPFELELSSTVWNSYRRRVSELDKLEEALEQPPVMLAADENARAILHALLLLLDERLREDPRVRDVDGQPFKIRHDASKTVVSGITIRVRLLHSLGDCELGVNALVPPNESGCDMIEINEPL